MVGVKDFWASSRSNWVEGWGMESIGGGTGEKDPRLQFWMY